MSVKRLLSVLIVAVLALMAAPATKAQPAPGGGAPGGGRPNFSDMIKQQLGCTDEEWTALQPKVEKVMQLSRDARGGRFGRGRGGPGGGGNQPQTNTPTSPVQTASDALKATLDNKDSKPDEIKAKLQALRDARTAAKAELAKGQAELRELLTQRQEAVLVQFGILE